MLPFLAFKPRGPRFPGLLPSIVAKHRCTFRFDLSSLSPVSKKMALVIGLTTGTLPHKNGFQRKEVAGFAVFQGLCSQPVCTGVQPAAGPPQRFFSRCSKQSRYSSSECSTPAARSAMSVRDQLVQVISATMSYTRSCKSDHRETADFLNEMELPMEPHNLLQSEAGPQLKGSPGKVTQKYMLGFNLYLDHAYTGEAGLGGTVLLQKWWPLHRSMTMTS